MRYGFCTNRISATKTKIDYNMLKHLKKSGYDYAEFSLALIESLSDEQFNELLRKLPNIGLDCDACNSLFPGRISLLGDEAKREIYEEYLIRAMSRAEKLGVKVVVFGSGDSRAIPQSYTKEQALEQLVNVIKNSIVPIGKKHNIVVVMEPLAPYACNFINTVREGFEIVQTVDSPSFKLLADTGHMLKQDEEPHWITAYADYIYHFHISEREREIPEDGYTKPLQKLISTLAETGYNKAISFESNNGYCNESMSKALKLLKSQF